MDFQSLMNKIYKNNNLSQTPQQDGRYQLRLDGHTISCYHRNKYAYLEADLGKINEGQTHDDLNQLLLARSLGFIRDMRACLSIDQDSEHYCLHQRIAMSHITPQNFQTTLEDFGGCLRYLKELMQHSVKK